MIDIYLITENEAFLTRAKLRDRTWKPKEYSRGEIKAFIDSGLFTFHNIDGADLNRLAVFALAGKLGMVIDDPVKDNLLK